MVTLNKKHNIMKTISVKATTRAEFGKKAAKAVRREVSCPCVLCGNGETVSFTFRAVEARRTRCSTNATSSTMTTSRPTSSARPSTEGTFVAGFHGEAAGRMIAGRSACPCVEALVKSVYDAHALDGMIGRAEEKITENALTENFARHEFKELWARINTSTPIP